MQTPIPAVDGSAGSSPLPTASSSLGQENAAYLSTKSTPKTDHVLNISKVVLDALQQATSFVPIPMIGQIAEIASSLVALAQRTRENTSLCHETITTCAHVAFCLYRKCDDLVKKKEIISPALYAQTEQLLNTMNKIKVQCNKISNRHVLVRAARTGLDKQKLGALNRQLSMSLVIFQVHSAMEFDTMLHRLVADAEMRSEKPQRTSPKSDASTPSPIPSPKFDASTPSPIPSTPWPAYPPGSGTYATHGSTVNNISNHNNTDCNIAINSNNIPAQSVYVHNIPYWGYGSFPGPQMGGNQWGQAYFPQSQFKS